MIVHRYDVLESTNLQLIKMAEENADTWTVVLADSQDGGVGRFGRFWWSPPGGLYMSVLARPDTGAESLPRFPILASLAVLDALGETKVPFRVKWPNDIFAGGKKLAGILIQARTERRQVAWVVAGFGINVRRPEIKPPDEIRDRIAFLDDLTVRDVSRDDLAEAVVTGFKRRLDVLDGPSWEKAMEQWTRSASWNKVYTHRDSNREISGTPLRLDQDGGLVLMTDRGEITVHSGELIESVQRPTSKV